MEEEQNEDVVADKDSFEIEKDNLVNKLNNLNIDDISYEMNENEILKNLKL